MGITSHSPQIEQSLHEKLMSSSQAKESLSFEEQVTLIQQALFEKDEDELDLGSSEALHGEDVEEGARKGKVPTTSTPLRKM